MRRRPDSVRVCECEGWNGLLLRVCVCACDTRTAQVYCVYKTIFRSRRHIIFCLSPAPRYLPPTALETRVPEAPVSRSSKPFGCLEGCSCFCCNKSRPNSSGFGIVLPDQEKTPEIKLQERRTANPQQANPLQCWWRGRSVNAE